MVFMGFINQFKTGGRPPYMRNMATLVEITIFHGTFYGHFFNRKLLVILSGYHPFFLPGPKRSTNHPTWSLGPAGRTKPVKLDIGGSSPRDVILAANNQQTCPRIRQKTKTSLYHPIEHTSARSTTVMFQAFRHKSAPARRSVPRP